MRVDVWLWAVRIFKTRSLATAACRGGHVRINGQAVKAASPLRVGDRVVARTAERERDVEVAGLIAKRVSAPKAAECIVDHSPPVEREPWVRPMFERPRGTGRPTKKDRRRLDAFRDR
ncbi:MAG: RNA-binding S4 domain-containing protein [Desertimonas sp.]